MNSVPANPGVPRPDAALAAAMCRHFANGMVPVDFEDGATLVNLNAPVDYLPLLLSGRGLAVRSFQGVDVPVGEVGPGALLGLEGVCGTGRHGMTVKALGPVRAAMVPREAFLDTIRTNPEAGLLAFTVLGTRLRACINSTADLKFRDATSRVARYLLETLTNGPEDTGTGTPCEGRLPFPKKTLAVHLGITQQSLSRVLNRLRDIGVTVLGGRIRVADSEHLAALATGEGGE